MGSYNVTSPIEQSARQYFWRVPTNGVHDYFKAEVMFKKTESRRKVLAQLLNESPQNLEAIRYASNPRLVYHDVLAQAINHKSLRHELTLFPQLK
jgi:hypothetical protein